MAHIRTLLLATVLLFALAGCRSKKAGREMSYVAIEVNETVLEERTADTIRLGRVRNGEIVKLELKVKNTGEKPFVISNFITSCGCTLFDFTREPIVPQSDRIVEMTFDSRGQYGDVVKSVMMQTSLGPIPHSIVVEAQVR